MRRLLCSSATFALLALGLAVPRAALAQNRDKWGVSDDSGIAPSEPSQAQWGSTAYARAREAGFGWSRYWLYWNNLNPSSGTYDFSSSDAEINAILANGLQVYGDIMWAPNWAVQGTPGYFPWNCMNPTTIAFVPTNAGCDPRRPDTTAFRTFVSQAVSHYGNRIRYWGFWNEPNYLIFWHSAYDPNDLSNAAYYNQNLQDLVDYVLIPGYEAAKQANPNVQIVGPEIDDPTGLQIILARDAQYFQQTGHHFLDVISFHQYPPNGDVTQEWAALDRYNAPGGPLALYRAGRPVWVSETGTHWGDQLFSGFDQRPWVDRVFFHGYKSGHCLNTSEDPICQNWWAQGSTGDALLDRMDVRLDQFYRIQSVIAPRLFTSQVPASFAGASPGYEVATQWSSSVNGTVKALRFYRAPRLGDLRRQRHGRLGLAGGFAGRRRGGDGGDPLSGLVQHQHHAGQDQLRHRLRDRQRPSDRLPGILGAADGQHAGQRQLQQLLRRRGLRAGHGDLHRADAGDVRQRYARL
jgi:hypothetical protein